MLLLWENSGSPVNNVFNFLHSASSALIYLEANLFAHRNPLHELLPPSPPSSTAGAPLMLYWLLAADLVNMLWVTFS